MSVAALKKAIAKAEPGGLTLKETRGLLALAQLDGTVSRGEAKALVDLYGRVDKMGKPAQAAFDRFFKDFGEVTYGPLRALAARQGLTGVAGLDEAPATSPERPGGYTLGGTYIFLREALPEPPPGTAWAFLGAAGSPGEVFVKLVSTGEPATGSSEYKPGGIYRVTTPLPTPREGYAWAMLGAAEESGYVYAKLVPAR